MPRGVHSYDVYCRWDGSLVEADYRRTHSVAVPGVDDQLALSSDAAFGGDESLLNPEDLFVAAASSCQLLSFLALARRHHIDVVGYVDHAIGEMPKSAAPMSVERIVLRPQITVRGEHDNAGLTTLFEQAHQLCFIANSLRTEVVLEPVWRRSEGAS